MPHDVTIDPGASVTVLGPSADTSVNSLQIGGGLGIATLALQGGSTLTTATGVVSVLPTSVLTGDGAVAGDVDNRGEVVAENLTVGGTLTNRGLIRGSGRINGAVVNAGDAEVRVAGGERLRLTGPSLTNSGRVEVIGSPFAAAEIEVDGATLNSASTGGARATFHDDLVQNGTLRVSAAGGTDSVAVFLGAFSASGGATGGGDLFFEGDLRPGNSPAVVTFDNDVFLGSGSTTEIEIAGLAEGAVVHSFDGLDLFITYAGGAGLNDVVLFTTVPEPSATTLLALGSLLALRRRT